jgi:hypothetical protein
MDLQLIGGIIGILIHIPLLISIWSGKVRQSFTTYALWSALDFIAAYSIYTQDGNFWLPFLYAIGAGLISLSLLIKKNFSWSNLDWFIAGFNSLIFFTSSFWRNSLFTRCYFLCMEKTYFSSFYLAYFCDDWQSLPLRRSLLYFD